jgi:hypothetical protein
VNCGDGRMRLQLGLRRGAGAGYGGRRLLLGRRRDAVSGDGGRRLLLGRRMGGDQHFLDRLFDVLYRLVLVAIIIIVLLPKWWRLPENWKTIKLFKT